MFRDFNYCTRTGISKSISRWARTAIYLVERMSASNWGLQSVSQLSQYSCFKDRGLQLNDWWWLTSSLHESKICYYIYQTLEEQRVMFVGMNLQFYSEWFDGLCLLSLFHFLSVSIGGWLIRQFQIRSKSSQPSQADNVNKLDTKSVHNLTRIKRCLDNLRDGHNKRRPRREWFPLQIVLCPAGISSLSIQHSTVLLSPCPGCKI